MSNDKPGFVLVHGAWHNHNTWDEVIPRLRDAGYNAEALDLPGAGANAAQPASFSQRPLDPAAFGTEPSPNAGVSQQQRTDAVIAKVKEVAAASNGKVILVGHSMGGVTISPVAEAVPDKLAVVVYLTAFMLPPEMPAIAMIQDDSNTGEQVAPLFMADPAATGALRLDVASEDAEYLAGVKNAFYGDLDETQFKEALRHLHCDEPVQVAVEPSPITVGNFGTVPRRYIYCTGDNAIRPAAQEKMVSLVDGAMGNTTTTHSLSTSHSPFYSAPDDLVSILTSI